MATVTVNAPTVLVVPSVPNFVQLVTGTEGARDHTAPVDIATLSTEQLRLLGEAWTEKLIAQAAARRERAA